jgi:hypothetical protein
MTTRIWIYEWLSNRRICHRRACCRTDTCTYGYTAALDNLAVGPVACKAISRRVRAVASSHTNVCKETV